MFKDRLPIIVILILAGAFARIVPHWPNFTPITAIALFSGATLVPRWKAFVIPAVALFLSDLVIGFYEQMWVTYLSFAAVVALGFLLQKNRGALRLLGVTVTGSLLFFAVSNFALWLPYDIYPKNAAGVVQSYLEALPFLKNAMLGDLFYVSLIFGAYALAEHVLFKSESQYRGANS